jgi:hypothetical protein
MKRKRVASFYFESECRQAPTQISSNLLSKLLLNVLGYNSERTALVIFV